MIEVIPSGRALGADVSGIDLAAELSPADIDAIKRAWSEHLVLRFRAQKLSDDDLLRFSRHFGVLDKAPINPYGTTWVPEHPEINVISNIVNDGGQRIGGLGDGEAKWHADMTYLDSPAKGCTLYALEIPPAGGDTGFNSM
ncbi:MAG: TauD/TfdA family dioxygenase, partial [Rhodospirillaceae bacterium]